MTPLTRTPNARAARCGARGLDMAPPERNAFSPPHAPRGRG
jgi:hypothetical protein